MAAYVPHKVPFCPNQAFGPVMNATTMPSPKIPVGILMAAITARTSSGGPAAAGAVYQDRAPSRLSLQLMRESIHRIV